MNIVNIVGMLAILSNLWCCSSLTDIDIAVDHGYGRHSYTVPKDDLLISMKVC